MKKIAPFIALIVSLSSLLGQEPLQVETYTLPNGFTVFLNEDHSQPEIYGGVAVRAGGKNDPRESTGIAHYLEHMLFKGTETLGTIDYAKEKVHLDSITYLYDQLGATTDEDLRKSIQMQINEQSRKAAEYSILNEFDNLLKSLGSTGVNAFTSNDITFYHNSFPPNELPRWLDLYAHRFEHPVFRAFQSELEVVYEEKNRAMDDYSYPIFENFSRHFYKNHPYGQQDVLGTVDHLKNPSLRRMYEFFNTYYVANNMSLVLVGDFDKAQIKPMIEAAFGQMRQGEVPAFPEYAEAPFAGREMLKMHAAPLKIGAMGYRSVPIGHPDQAAIEVASALLFNENETGMLNQLVLDNKLLFAGAFPGAEKDLGSNIFFFLPKLVGQSLGNAEKMVLGEIGRLREGEYTDTYLQSVKQSIVNEYESSIEDFYSRGVSLAQAFANEQSWTTVNTYPQQIAAVSRADVERVSRQYFGDNYLILFSGRGFPKKTKLEKPGFKPVKPTQGMKSVYARAFEDMPKLTVDPRPLDVKNDVTRLSLPGASELVMAENPVNSLFSLDIEYAVGQANYPGLEAATLLLNYSGAGDQDLKQIKSAFQELNCTFSARISHRYLTLSLDGPDKNLEQALALTGTLLRDLNADEATLKLVQDEIKSSRRFEGREPATTGAALCEYARYGDQSSYLRRMSKSQLMGATLAQLMDTLAIARTYPAKVYYTGNQTAQWVAQWLGTSIPWTDQPKPAASPAKVVFKPFSENTVFVLDEPKAVQSQVYFIVSSDSVKQGDYPSLNAFNTYFGSGFSGLVLQEIREYRSLAYSTGASFLTAQTPNNPSQLYAFVGCQSDKTPEALAVMDSLIRFMPLRTEREALVKSSLIQGALFSRPEFRAIPRTVITWENKGFIGDPNPEWVKAYEAMDFEAINEFYKTYIQGRIRVITIVGDGKRIGKDGLSEYGKVIEMKKEDVLRW